MSKKWELLYLSQEDCVAAGGTDMDGAMKAVERSFFLHGKGDFIQPGKPVIRWGGPETEETIGRIMSMPSWLGGEQHRGELEKRDLVGPVNTAGIKLMSSRPWNPQRYGLPRGSGLIIIVDPETLIPACVMDAAIVSAMRTGAASGIAAKYLANPDSKIYGLVGASVQGHTQIMAMKKSIPSLEKCKVYDINRKTAEKFARDMADGSQMKIDVVNSAEEAFRDADIVSTATIASSPYVKPEWYKEGVFHAESSFWDTPPEALRVMDLIVVDDWDQVRHHGVDVSWRAVRDGIIKESRITGNLGEIVVGKKKGRTDKKQRTFFNPIGLGIHDLSEAFRVFQNAKQMGVGKKMTLFEDPDGWLRKIRL
jgi:ornithine cyclodeaminase/alanine dehydrogenase-like protein (mu-crystallin family)